MNMGEYRPCMCIRMHPGWAVVASLSISRQHSNSSGSADRNFGFDARERARDPEKKKEEVAFYLQVCFRIYTCILRMRALSLNSDPDPPI
jgi:hypothetical protein